MEFEDMHALDSIVRANSWIDAHILRRLLGNRLGARYWSFWARLVLRCRKPLIIGITGSAGKTTTVHMIATVLSHPEAEKSVGLVGHTAHNMNDVFGVPMSVLRYEDWPGWRQMVTATLLLPLRGLWLACFGRYPRVLVLEYSAHKPGVLDGLLTVARPDIGVVTTIGPAHLEQLRTVQGVVREKGKIVRSVPAEGLVLLGTGHDYVSDLENLARAPVVKLPGRGRDLSREMARAIARHLGVPDRAIDSALSEFHAVKGRLKESTVRGMTVIDDSYNANPLSMRLGLDELAAAARQEERRVACLGAMAELGDEAALYHEEVGAYARQKSDLVIGVGALAQLYRPDHWFPDSVECARQVQGLVRAGDRVLVKGSASTRMGLVVKALNDEGTGYPDPGRQSWRADGTAPRC